MKQNIPLSCYRDDVRWAIKRRAQTLAFLYKELRERFDEDVATDIAKMAVFKYGKATALNILKRYPKLKEGDVKDFLETVFGAKKVKVAFDQQVIEKTATHAVMRNHFCPLLEGWKEIGCTIDEARRLCEIAETFDEGMSNVFPIKYYASETISSGNPYCEIVMKKNRKNLRHAHK